MKPLLYLLSAACLVCAPQAMAQSAPSTDVSHDATAPAWSARTREDDPALQTAMVAIPGAIAGLKAYEAAPASAAAPRGAVILLVENRGLTPHVMDMARRYALEGFLVLAPDTLSPLSPPADEAAAHEMIEHQPDADVIAQVHQMEAYLRTRADVSGIGLVGYGKGGSITDHVIEDDAVLAAAVTFYASNVTDLAKAGQIHAALMKHANAPDERRNAKLAPLAEALTASGTPFEFLTYDGAPWGFANAYGPAYDAAAETLAFGRTIPFLHRTLEPATTQAHPAAEGGR